MDHDGSQQYKLMDLRDRPEVIQYIREAEQQLNQAIDGEVALIAYVRKK
ncbi:MAG: hypothetical protein ACOYEF_09980 [Planifilum sp.]|jgi:hypothetical protein